MYLRQLLGQFKETDGFSDDNVAQFRNSVRVERIHSAHIIGLSATVSQKHMTVFSCVNVERSRSSVRVELTFAFFIYLFI